MSSRDLRSPASGPLPAANHEAEDQPQSTVFQCAVSADAVRRALCVVRLNETRYYLSGVYVTPAEDGGAYVVGTDGAALVCIRDPGADVTGSAILNPNEATRNALRADWRDKGPRLLFARNDRIVVAAVSYDSADEVLERPNAHCVAAQFREATIDGKYPDWRAVMRAPVSGAPIPCVDARLLKRLGRALASHLEEVRAPVTLIPTGRAECDPIWVLGRCRNGVGVIAGLRGDAGHNTLPDWIGAAAPQVLVKTPAEEAQASGLAAGSHPGSSPQPREDQ